MTQYLPSSVDVSSYPKMWWSNTLARPVFFSSFTWNVYTVYGQIGLIYINSNTRSKSSRKAIVTKKWDELFFKHYFIPIYNLIGLTILTIWTIAWRSIDFSFFEKLDEIHKGLKHSISSSHHTIRCEIPTFNALIPFYRACRIRSVTPSHCLITSLRYDHSSASVRSFICCVILSINLGM